MSVDKSFRMTSMDSDFPLVNLMVAAAAKDVKSMSWSMSHYCVIRDHLANFQEKLLEILILCENKSIRIPTRRYKLASYISNTTLINSM